MKFSGEIIVEIGFVTNRYIPLTIYKEKEKEDFVI